jgi:anti-sigma regulatory factor (Ser/Thr protein kinase)
VTVTCSSGVGAAERRLGMRTGPAGQTLEANPSVGGRPPRTGVPLVCRTATLALPGVPASPRQARAFLRERLAAWGWRPATGSVAMAEQGQLVLTELVTNAVRHAGGDVQVRIEVHHDRITLSVTDPVRLSRPLRPLQVTTASPTGRGLTIVDTLSSAWGVTEQASGKTVWAELPVDGASWPENPCRQ